MLMRSLSLLSPRPLARVQPGQLRLLCSPKPFRTAPGPVAHQVAASRDPPAVCTASSSAEPTVAEQDGTEKKRLGKRKVALYLGYEGTGYKGLQINRATAPDATIEDVLEEAIFQSGGILESNRGALDKLRWQRSSRTDKSVHSLATVISLKLECDPDSFATDPEGLALAAGINEHLPPEMRVFSVQRVSKNFSARAECNRRVYHYYLPASVLGLKLDGGPEDATTLARLAECWGSFEGHHPFHNYTKRRLYRTEAGDAPGLGGRNDERRLRRVRRQKAGAALEGEEEEEEEGSEGEASASDWEPSDAESRLGLVAAAGASGYDSDASSAFEAPAGRGSGSGDGSAAALTPEQLARAAEKSKISVEWKAEKDRRDPVVRRHYRYMDWCRCNGEVAPLVPGGPPCVRLSLCGNSFMLHQIRKMVAASVAVARGILPLALVRASLAAPARLVLPLAPPMTLVLAGAAFSPFRKSWDNRAAAAALWTGERLDLKAGGEAQQQQFWEQMLRPAVSELLASEEWAEWDATLQRLWCDEAEVAALVAAEAEWRQGQAERRSARLETQLTEAAALENPDES